MVVQKSLNNVDLQQDIDVKLTNPLLSVLDELASRFPLHECIWMKKDLSFQKKTSYVTGNILYICYIHRVHLKKI